MRAQQKLITLFHHKPLQHIEHKKVTGVHWNFTSGRFSVSREWVLIVKPSRRHGHVTNLNFIVSDLVNIRLALVWFLKLVWEVVSQRRIFSAKTHLTVAVTWSVFISLYEACGLDSQLICQQKMNHLFSQVICLTNFSSSRTKHSLNKQLQYYYCY